jgi:hypothetical protein
MPQTVLTDDSCSIEAPPVRLVFRWTGDRWSHAIEAGAETLASSEEWDAERGDPARVVSPAYQQLSHGHSALGEQALLVGQWGPHHFSGVFTVTGGGSGVVIEADVAVRTRADLASLASTYRVHRHSGDLAEANPSGIAWELAAPVPGRLRLEPGATGRVSLAEAGRRETRVQAEGIVVAGARSHRLVYRWCWSSSPTDTR